ncbi:MAG: 3-keto-disaccharide hydrolase, partial [Verrucomicrobiia bacterium]
SSTVRMFKNIILASAIIVASTSTTQAGLKLKSIFNGKNLAGWEAPTGNAGIGWYKAADGILKVRNGPNKKGSILWTKQSYRDFVIEFDFRFGDGVVDTGIHIRNSKEQIQIGISGSLKRDLTGSPYIAGKGYPVEAKGVAKLLKAKDWNTMKIKAVGKDYTVWLQGQQVMTYRSDTAIEEGPLGIQLHGSRIMGVDFRNLRLAELP